MYRSDYMKKSWIPNIFTFTNLGCGVLSILSTFEHKYINACIFIIIAALGSPGSQLKTTSTHRSQRLRIRP